MPESDDKTMVALALVGLLIMSLLGFAIYKGITYVAEKKKDKKVDEINTNSLLIKIKDKNSYIYDIRYKFLDGRNVISESKILDGMVEKIDNLENKSYTISISDPNYYDKEQFCNPKDIVCEVELEKYPSVTKNIVRFDDNYYRLLLYFKDGTFKEPIICVSENSEKIKNIKMQIYNFDIIDSTDLMKIQKPNRLSLYVDTCFMRYSKEYIIDQLMRNETMTYEGDIKKYNKEYKVKYDGFHNITYTQSDLIKYPIESYTDGVFEYDIRLEYWNNKQFEEDDKIRIYLIDQYSLTNDMDVGMKDIIDEYVINQ